GGELPALKPGGTRPTRTWPPIYPRIAPPDDGSERVSVSPDVKRIAVALPPGDDSDGPKLGLYAIVASDDPLTEFKLTETVMVPASHRGRISAMPFSPDGKILATGSEDSSIGLWDVTKVGKDWKPFATIAAGQFAVWCLAFSPDGRTLVAGTSD